MPSREQGQPDILRVFTSRRETRAFYDKISDVYDLLSDQTEAPVREAGLEMLSAQPGERVLEIGCGTGHALAALAGSVGPHGQVLGADLSERMLKRSRARLTQRGVTARAELSCADGILLPFRAGLSSWGCPRKGRVDCWWKHTNGPIVISLISWTAGRFWSPAHSKQRGLE